MYTDRLRYRHVDIQYKDNQYKDIAYRKKYTGYRVYRSISIE